MFVFGYYIQWLLFLLQFGLYNLSTIFRDDPPGQADIQSSREFEYNPNSKRGPFMWKYIWNECNAILQSPININTSEVVYKRPYSIQYNLENIRMKGDFINNGHTCALYPRQKLRVLYGVPHCERDMFVLDHLHIHFGNDIEHGSEHSMDNRFFPIELHIVHYNSKYESAKNASKHRDGIVALAIFFEVGHGGNTEIDKFIQTYVPYVRRPGYKGVPAELDISSIIPYTRDFFTYFGTKTTPPCDHNTRWIIMRHHKTITPKSHRLLYFLLNKKGERISRYGNFRPVQDGSCRYIEANF